MRFAGGQGDKGDDRPPPLQRNDDKQHAKEGQAEPGPEVCFLLALISRCYVTKQA